MLILKTNRLFITIYLSIYHESYSIYLLKLWLTIAIDKLFTILSRRKSYSLHNDEYLFIFIEKHFLNF